MPRRVELAAVVAVVILGSCGGRTHNVADASFVARMIPHHHLGMELLDEATLNSDGVELRRLVFEMGAYHRDELAALDRWADEWGVPAAHGFPGDIAPASVRLLATLSGPAHDTWWLRLMIDHHRGALVIAHEAVAAAGDPGVVTMARSVISTQEKQIADMEDLARRLCTATAGLPGC